MFSRNSDSALHAAISAVEHLRAAGMNVTGAREDLVVTEEIAERARVTSAAARYWVTGARFVG